MFVDCHKREPLGVPIVQITDKFCYECCVRLGRNRTGIEAGVMEERAKFFAA